MNQDGEDLYFKNYNTWVKGNTLKFANLTHQRVVPEFVNSIKRLFFKFKHKTIVLDFSEVDKIYPYPTAAIAGYIYYFKEKLDVNFECINIPVYLERLHFLDPALVGETKINKNDNCVRLHYFFRQYYIPWTN